MREATKGQHLRIDRCGMENSERTGTMQEMQGEMTPVKIYVDKREMRSPVPQELIKLGCDIEYKFLEVGDYIVSDRVCFERKAPEDFFNSLFTDRKIFGQVLDVAHSYSIPILLFEGYEGEIFNTRNVNPKAMQGILNAFALMRVPVLYSLNPAGSAQIIAMIANKEQNEDKRSISLHGKRSGMDKSEQLVYTLSSLTDCGIGAEQAKKLLSHFGSLERIAFASVDDLRECPGIDKKAEKIFEFFTRKYSNSKEKL